ncbi:peroxiredoxin family protein [Mucilaginibacter phyllosphaerae]
MQSNSFCQVSNIVSIIGTGVTLKNDDSVSFSIARFNLDVANKKFYIKNKTVVKNQEFKITIPDLVEPTYINISAQRSGMPLLYHFLVSPGDNINLTFFENDYTVSGDRSGCFELQHKMRSMINHSPMPTSSTGTILPYLKSVDSLARSLQNLLNENKSLLTVQEWDILNTDLITFKGFQYYHINASMPEIKAQRPGYISDIKSYLASNITFRSQINLSANSLYYAEYLLEKFKFDSCAVINRPFEMKPYLQYLLKNLSGLQRDKSIVYALIKSKEISGDITEELNLAIAKASNPELATTITEFRNLKTDGATAFDFSLTDVNGKQVKLSDFRGKPVILDFWFTGCAACRELAPYMKKIEEKFAGQNVKFIGISIDKDRNTWRESIKSNKYVSPEIINLITNGNGNLDTVIDRYKVSSYPSLFLIDKNGKLFNIQNDPRADDGAHLKGMIEKNL